MNIRNLKIGEKPPMDLLLLADPSHTLFISHDLVAVRQMSQRIMVMKEGKLVDQFKRDHLFAEERHPYTKELISIF